MRLLAVLAICAIALSSCGETIKGNGNIITEKRDVDGFSSIEISGVFAVELTKGAPGLEIVADDNLMEHIFTDVKNGELRIYTNDKYLESEELVLKVSFDELTEIAVSGAVEIDAKSTIDGDKFRLGVSGAAKAELDVDVNTLTLDLSGGSEVDVRGNASNATFDISGAGEVRAFDLQTKTCAISVSGAGEVEISVDDELDVDVSGAGDVRYKGDPTVNQSISGAGEVKKI